VDVVEGVCAQTKVVLKQAWLEHIRPVLVLNKIDRLITEMKLKPLDAYVRMMQLLEQVNAIVGELFTIDVMSKAEGLADASSGLDEADDSDLYFAPEQGNVVFASAADGWGFSLVDFARMFASKLGVDQRELESSLWGDFYFNSKEKSILPGAQAKAKKPLFVQIVLENLWAVYEAVVIRKDKIMVEKIVQSLNLKVLPRDLKHSDPKVQIQAILTQWLPLSDAVLSKYLSLFKINLMNFRVTYFSGVLICTVLVCYFTGMVCEKLPGPLHMTSARAEKLMSSRTKTFDSLPPATQKLKDDFIACSPAEEAPVIVFVSKMIPVSLKTFLEY
jgi:ribosome assembly protein 1